MKTLIITLIIIAVLVSLSILIFNTYSKFNIIKIKMNSANDSITEALKKKLTLMNKLYTQIKKVIEKKDYLKSFSSLKSNNLNNYELDKELTNYLDLMEKLADDYSKLRKKEIKELFSQIREVDQELIANKKFYNKNNNQLIKEMKGYQKIIAKFIHINIKNSYEIKESSYE